METEDVGCARAWVPEAAPRRVRDLRKGGNLALYGPQQIAGVSEGQVLAGKYRIERVLGAGGMGVVVAAYHLHLDEKVAIKFLRPETLSSPETVARFAREARAASKIKSEHVARVIDVGTLDNGAPYTVMEYLDGTDLAEWIREQGPLAVELAVDFVLQACEAVVEAHVLGIVHRDLKPANLFIIRRPDGQLSTKVLDFGISKVSGGAATTGAMTSTSATMGSPLYMSPEQMHSASGVDARTDIWALGIVLYEALAGVPPFRGSTLPEVCAMILTTEPPPLRAQRPDLPQGLEALIRKCLAKDRQQRFRDVGELAAPLAAFGSEHARLSARRIAGVLRTSGLPASCPAASAPGSAKEVTLAAPRGTFAAPSALPVAGTEHPVVNTLPESATAPRSRLLVWAAGAGVMLVGAGAALFAHGSYPATDRAVTSAGAASTQPQIEAPVARPVVPSSTPAPVTIAPPPTPSEAAPHAASPAETAPRPRPETKRRSPAIAPASAVASVVPPRPAPAASVSATATTDNCRVVSTFDGDGAQHFKEVCGGN